MAGDDPFIHHLALCETDQIGPRSRVWAFAHLLPGARVGADCNICDGVFVEGDVTIGDRVTVKSGVQLWDGVRLADDVFVGPNATFTNDRFPRSGQHLDSYPTTLVEKGASLGANCTVLPGLRIGRYAMVGAGAVVTKDVPPNAIVVGNPARIVGYVGAAHASVGATDASVAAEATEAHGEAVASGDLGVGSVRVIELPSFEDMRGSLTVADLGTHVPFPVRRFFLVYGVPGREVRGEHAHRTCHQFLVCLHGSVHLLVDDGTQRADVELSSPSIGVYVPPLVWGSQFNYSPDAVLGVFASHPYDNDDYLRTYEEFIAALEG